MEHLLDIKDAAGFLNVSEITIRRWTNSGKLKCYRVGGKKERRFQMTDLEEMLEDSKGLKPRPLGFEDQKVPAGSHMTHFYSEDKEAFEVSVLYLLEGISRGDALLAVMPPQKGEELLQYFAHNRYPVGNWVESGRLTLSDGMDSPGEMIRYLTGFGAGPSEFRVVGDMSWTFRKGWDLATLRTLEQAPALAPPVEKGLLLCQYSLEDFSGAHIMMAAECHRQTLYKGKVKESPYCPAIKEPSK